MGHSLVTAVCWKASSLPKIATLSWFSVTVGTAAGLHSGLAKTMGAPTALASGPPLIASGKALPVAKMNLEKSDP